MVVKVRMSLWEPVCDILGTQEVHLTQSLKDIRAFKGKKMLTYVGKGTSKTRNGLLAVDGVPELL